jgi:hypothetical protein
VFFHSSFLPLNSHSLSCCFSYFCFSLLEFDNYIGRSDGQMPAYQLLLNWLMVAMFWGSWENHEPRRTCGLDWETHCFKNDFTRHCPNINRSGHKIQPSRKMPNDWRRRSFYLLRHQKMTTSQNRLMEAEGLFTEAVRKYPPPKIDLRRQAS